MLLMDDGLEVNVFYFLDRSREKCALDQQHKTPSTEKNRRNNKPQYNHSGVTVDDDELKEVINFRA